MPLEDGDGVVSGGVHVDVGTEVPGRRFLFTSASDGDGAESHVPRELDPEMPEAADALYGDHVSATQAGIPKRVVRRDAGAEKRRCLHRAQVFRIDARPRASAIITSAYPPSMVMPGITGFWQFTMSPRRHGSQTPSSPPKKPMTVAGSCGR